MGKWKREGLILHGEEKSEGGLSVKQRRDERGRGTWTFGKDFGAEKKAKENQRKKEEKFLRENLEKGWFQAQNP